MAAAVPTHEASAFAATVSSNASKNSFNVVVVVGVVVGAGVVVDAGGGLGDEPSAFSGLAAVAPPSASAVVFSTP